MYPHERSLVKRLEGKPFVLLGVNSDATKEKLKKAIETEHLGWRSWWDDGGKRGPIATRWNIHAWPTIYLIDARGIIRYKDVQKKELDQALDLLLAEQPQGETSAQK
jgi:hypothetical protein